MDTVRTFTEPSHALALSPRLFFYQQPQAQEDVLGELLQGLRQTPRAIAPKFFYDATGAALFDRITLTPEYYPTRLERQIFSTHGAEIARAVGTERVLIEPGSGSSEKVGLLLNDLKPCAYVPVEITETHLLTASRKLVEEYPWLEVHAVCTDYSDGIEVPPEVPAGRRLLFFPGSTIGNFEPAQARLFLAQLHKACGKQGSLLIGVDLRKDTATLNAAYNDGDGITARFNLNVLEHINRLADGDFSTDNFRHLAFFNETASRVEMHLESCCQQTVSLASETLSLSAGERIHTENSYKYTVEGFQALAADAGFKPRQTWLDPSGWFSVHLLDARSL